MRPFGPRIVFWFEDRLDIIKELHDEVGHYGVVRTQHLVREGFIGSVCRATGPTYNIAPDARLGVLKLNFN
jgi:hypothetical protein